MHRVLGGVVALDGEERSGTHVKCNLVKIKALLLHLRNHFVCEVQTCCRCSYRAFELGIYGLVACEVYLLALAIEVWRNGNTSKIFEQLTKRKVHVPLKTHYVLTLATFRNLGAQGARRTLVVKVNTDKSLFPLLKVAHNAAPLALALYGEGVLIVGRSVWLKAEHLDAGSRRFVHNDTRADNLRVVEDEQRALGQLLGQ